jgi:BTB/POZ domain
VACSSLQVDEFHKDAAGHGWPKLFSTSSLKNFQDGLTCVVSLQILQPGSLSSSGYSLRKPMTISVRHYGDQRRPHPMSSLRSAVFQCDAVLQSSDWRWLKAHRFVLASKSELFRKLLLSDQGTPFVYKSNHSLEQLEHLLDLLYLDRLPKRNVKLSKELLELARFYQITTVLMALEHDHRRFTKA